MNLRLLIIFGLVIQLFAVGHAAPCSSEVGAGSIADHVTPSCEGCCSHKAPANEEPSPDPDSPCQACPLCCEVSSEPNRFAVLWAHELPRPFEDLGPEHWSLIEDHDANTRARVARRWNKIASPTGMPRLPELCRWLT